MCAYRVDKQTTDPYSTIRKHQFDLALKNLQNHLAKTKLTKKQLEDIKNKKNVKLSKTYLVPTNKKPVKKVVKKRKTKSRKKV